MQNKGLNLKQLAKMLICAIAPRGLKLKSVLNNGVIVRGENRPGYGGRGVFIYGDELEPELRFLQRFVPSEGVFLDIGANVGVFSMKAAKAVGPDGMVLALEPFPRMASQLLENSLENGFDHVRIRVCCVSDREGDAQFWMNRNAPNSFSLFPEKGAVAFNVRTVSIDSLLKMEAVQRLDYLKIDAEGAEEMILNGGRESIEAFRPVIQIEVIKKVPLVSLRNYNCWYVDEGLNHLLIPAESVYNQVAEELGWLKA